MRYTTGEDLVEAITVRTGVPVRVWPPETDRYMGDPETKAVWNCIVSRHMDETSLQDMIDKGGYLDFIFGSEEQVDPRFLLNKAALDYYSEAAYFGRWFQVEYFAECIREEGFPSPGEYEDHVAKWQLNQRLNYYREVKRFGASRCVIFCEDKHQEWLEYFLEKQWSIDQFMEWGKRDFIFVRMQDLANFSFPKDPPDYYRVFIYDDFADLKEAKV